MFVSRATPPLAVKDALAVSYRAPMGRLAAMRVGREHEIVTPRGSRYFELLERAVLKPTQDLQGWDSVNTIVQGQGYGPLTVVSLRALLRSFGIEESDLDLLDRLLEEDRTSNNLLEGIQRSVIDKMGLRDRPLLDEFQDTIFRLPIDTRLVILGPPGTGKTTTLIKRLGLKLDIEYLEEQEKAALAQSAAGVEGSSVSWLMFTPTELLKQYVKEAFARENIPASDLRIQTWQDFRRDLARNKLGVLRTSSNRGFVLKDGLPSLQDVAIKEPTPWFADFDTWQSALFWSELQAAVELLGRDADTKMATLGARLSRIVASPGARGSHASVLLAINDLANEVNGLSLAIQADVESRLRQAFAQELKRDSGLLDDLLGLLRTLAGPADASDDADDPEAEEEEEDGRPPHGDREDAFEAYKRAVRAHTRATVAGRAVGRRSRNGRILEWLGPRSLVEADRLTIGQMLQVRSALRRFANPMRQYVERVASRYRRFRRERQSDASWYRTGGFEASELNPLELDIILLAMFRAAGALLEDRRMLRLIDEPRFGILKTFRELYRTQMVVDEATDFSPIQLSCMAAL
jgi:hypothetical protein